MLARKALSASLSAPPKAYVEEVFSTQLYTGNSSNKSITNDIQLGASYSGTTLKLNFDSNNTDSANSFTPTVTGTAGYSTADAKFGAGSCAGFNSSSWLDYNADAGNFGSGDWTVEFWVKTSSGNGPGIVTQAFGAGAGATSWGFFVGYGTSGNVALYLSDGSTYFASITSGTTAVNNNTWNHVAACRSGSTVYLFLNGVSQGTASVGTTALGNGGARVRIGAQGTSYAMPSGTYIDDVRIIKGTALYTSGFTPPSAATDTTSYPPTTVAGKGGMIWTACRSDPQGHWIVDTARGAGYQLPTWLTNADSYEAQSINAFNSNGYSMGSKADVNYTGYTYVSWTFRKAKKFFDIVTYTGDGNAGRTVSHNLGSTPGCMIIKRTDTTGSWCVWNRGASTLAGRLENTGIFESGYYSGFFNSTQPTSTVFTVGSDGRINASGGTYIAYLFAHDAGGFGDAGDQSIIKCGSFTTNGSGGTSEISLGYEPQWLLIKNTSAAEKWYMWDIMRGWSHSNSPFLSPNTSSAETGATPGGEGYGKPTATGFSFDNFALGASNNYIYIAIRKGPMKTPTDATRVFAVTSFTGADAAQTSNFPVDFVMNSENLTGTVGWYWVDRLRGATKKLESNATNAEGSVSSGVWDSNTTVRISGSGNSYKRSYPMFRRAPGFFDVVCYTGTGSATTFSHNLGVVPEMMIVKHRNGPDDWAVYHSALGNTKYLWLNSTNAEATSQFYWNNTTPTTSVFTLGTQGRVNDSGGTYVAYLFASVSGVSKVGSFNNAGSDFDVNCGFTNGARFVLVKRYSSTGGGWFVFDSARGIVAGNDPMLGLNTTTPEDTSGDYIDTYSQGFRFNGSAFATGDYIYLAIA